MEFNRIILPTGYNGMQKDEQTDFYRIENGIPLEGHGPERFLASKSPLRKNKDYRPRFRNFVLGFPIYKKDNYTRHLYNLDDILDDDHAPIMKYTKTFLKAYIAGTLLGVYYVGMNTSRFGLANTLRRTNSNYLKISTRFEATRAYYIKAKPGIFGFAVLATVFRILGDHLVNSYQYSSHQAAVYTICLMSAPTIFLIKDRFYSPFWVLTGAFAATTYVIFYNLFINRGFADTGFSSPKPTFIYLKSVTPEEREKIEFQDRIEKFTRKFLEYERFNMYGHAYDKSNISRFGMI